MAKGAAKTGSQPTVLLAIEQSFSNEQCILRDTFALHILSHAERLMVALFSLRALRTLMIKSGEKSLPGAWCGILLRKRYIDEKLSESLAGVEAVVNLGAGMDTRAFRLAQLHNKPIWELDQPENIAAKRTWIEKALSEVPKNIRLVAIDFDNEDIAAALAQNSYPKSAKTFFIWEGVTQYLTAEGIDASFSFLSAAPSGSFLAFTYVLRDFLEGKKLYGWEKAYQRYVLEDKIWLFGMNPDEWPSFLEKYGWRMLDDEDAAELAERYAVPRERKLSTSPIERMAFAVKL